MFKNIKPEATLQVFFDLIKKLIFMKNRLYPFFFLTIVFLFSCNNDDDNNEATNSKMRVNHYQDTALISFFGTPTTTLLIQTDDKIGSETFEITTNAIEGLEYELGFIYDLEVRVTEIKNPPADASNIKITLVKVLSKTPVDTNTEFKVRLTLNQQGGEFIKWIKIEDANFGFMNSSISIDCKNLCTELTSKIENKEQVIGTFTHGEGNTYILKKLLNE